MGSGSTGACLVDTVKLWRGGVMIKPVMTGSDPIWAIRLTNQLQELSPDINLRGYDINLRGWGCRLPISGEGLLLNLETMDTNRCHQTWLADPYKIKVLLSLDNPLQYIFPWPWPWPPEATVFCHPERSIHSWAVQEGIPIDSVANISLMLLICEAATIQK